MASKLNIHSINSPYFNKEKSGDMSSSLSGINSSAIVPNDGSTFNEAIPLVYCAIQNPLWSLKPSCPVVTCLSAQDP